MRLIDADSFKGKVIASHCYSGVNKLINIDDVPTAYDVDKVIEQLEVGLANECVYERDQKVYTEAIRCAIDIVKDGGINGLD